MTAGATMTALVFHFVPEEAEPVSLAIATGFAVAAGVVSLLRRPRRAALV